MDRYKEALDQHIRGEWMSSISLCGDIVEFIVYEFWSAYNDDIAVDSRKTPSESTIANLKTLNKFRTAGKNPRKKNRKIIGSRDFKRLKTVRDMRDTHVHYRRRDRLLTDYPAHLKSDNVEALRKLTEFFTESNMVSKYGKYLEYADKQEAQARVQHEHEQ